MINDIKNALKNLSRRGQHNVAKIICLTLGLAVSSVIIAELYFEQTYDTYMPEWKHTYQVDECFVQNGKYDEWNQTSGAIAHGIKAYCPQVEAATRYTWVNSGTQVEVGRKKELKANVALADSCLMDVLPRPMVQGNAKKVLSLPKYCIVSKSFAERAGGNVVGKRLTGAELFGESLTIGGVFKDYPKNSSFNRVDVLVSMTTIHLYPNFDGSGMWMGNDRYRSFVRLHKGSDPDALKPAMKKMLEANLPMKQMKENGMEYSLSLVNISKAYTSDPYVKKMFWILSILAFMIVFASVMNYLLIVAGNMATRTREMAVRKCYGAGRGKILSIVFSEAVVHLVISIVLALAFLFACKGTVENFLSAPLEVLFFNLGAWIIGAICLAVLLIGGLLPGLLYSRTSVATAFRGYSTARYRWKPVLLAVQFVAAGLLFSLLFVINSQYNHMLDDDPGYEYKDLAVLSVDGIEEKDRAAIMQELGRMAEIEQLASSDCIPIGPKSGNNIYLPGSDKELFNVCDQYSVSDGYLRLMGMKLIEGDGFSAHQDSIGEVIVSSDFVEKLRKAAPFKGSIIGKRILITEHSDRGNKPFAVCGVYKKIRIGDAAQPDDRPSIMFHATDTRGNMLIRFHSLTADAMQKVREKIGDEYPDRNISLLSYSTMMTDQYAQTNSFRGGVLVAGCVILVIALLGLVGYTVDEVNRRSKEIAIRKVNGATEREVQRLFLRDTLVMAVPSVLVGCVIAWLIVGEWLKSFAERIALMPWPFLVAAVIIIVVAVAVVSWNCRRVARSNPMEYLKDL